jgi:DNA-directed RNA polymerase specialized sigma24 family protein
MDRTAAMAELPEAYATALRLHNEDFDTETIAARLGIEIEAVAPLLKLAAAKLEHLLASSRPASQGRSKADAGKHELNASDEQPM